MQNIIRLLIVSFLLVISMSGNAQVSRGHIQIGTPFTFSSYHDQVFNKERSFDSVTNIKEWKISAVPAIGLGLGKNFVIGIGIGYTHSNSESKSLLDDKRSYGTKTRVNSVVYKIYLRKNIPFNEKSGMYGELGSSYSSSRSVETELTPAVPYKTKYTATSASLVPGIYYRISNRFCLDVQFGGIIYSYKKDNPLLREKYHSFEFTLPGTIGVGFQITL
jgi:hypothetical protein